MSGIGGLPSWCPSGTSAGQARGCAPLLPLDEPPEREPDDERDDERDLLDEEEDFPAELDGIGRYPERGHTLIERRFS